MFKNSKPIFVKNNPEKSEAQKSIISSFPHFTSILIILFIFEC